MVGPWQVPVADCAVTLSGFDGYAGEAMAIGERTPVALLDAPGLGAARGRRGDHEPRSPRRRRARRRQAVGELDGRGGTRGGRALFDTVHAVGEELCPALGIAIPVGKDSLSMRTAGGRRPGERAVSRRCR
jgi:phosphoribosylformylglycinamidine synthase